MKKLLVFTLCLFPLATIAARIDATGDVGTIRYHASPSTLAPSWEKGIWFQLEGSNVQFCTDNKISIEPGNETAISMLLLAKTANRQVKVTVDDSVFYPAGGHCKLQFLNVL